MPPPCWRMAAGWPFLSEPPPEGLAADGVGLAAIRKAFSWAERTPWALGENGERNWDLPIPGSVC